MGHERSAGHGRRRSGSHTSQEPGAGANAAGCGQTVRLLTCLQSPQMSGRQGACTSCEQRMPRLHACMHARASCLRIRRCCTCWLACPTHACHAIAMPCEWSVFLAGETSAGVWQAGWVGGGSKPTRPPDDVSRQAWSRHHSFDPACALAQKKASRWCAASIAHCIASMAARVQPPPSAGQPSVLAQGARALNANACSFVSLSSRSSSAEGSPIRCGSPEDERTVSVQEWEQAWARALGEGHPSFAPSSTRAPSTFLNLAAGHQHGGDGAGR